MCSSGEIEYLRKQRGTNGMIGASNECHYLINSFDDLLVFSTQHQLRIKHNIHAEDKRSKTGIHQICNLEKIHEKNM